MPDAPNPAAPTLLLIVGPPAVGKMAVGHEIALRTGLRLFHNHLSVEPVLGLFEFGSPPFGRLVSEFRRHVFAEVAASDLPGLIFTYVQAFELPEDHAELDAFATPFRQRGSRVLTVELAASQQARLDRNETEFRLAEKPSKRDLVASRHRLLAADSAHRLNSGAEFAGGPDYLRIDNTESSPADVAEQVIDRFGLTRRC